MARSLFSIDQKSIQINDVHSTVSKNKALLTTHLGSFSATMHNVETLKTLKNPGQESSPNDLMGEQNEDLLITDITPVENHTNDLLMMNVPGLSPSNPLQNANQPDLFGLDVPVNTQPPLPVSLPKPPVQK